MQNIENGCLLCVCVYTQMQQLREELESVCCERERLLSERSLVSHTDTEQIKAEITSLTEEREQLQHTLQDLRDQLIATEQTVHTLRCTLNDNLTATFKLHINRIVPMKPI